MTTWYNIKDCDFPNILISYIDLLCKVQVKYEIPFFLVVRWNGKEKKILTIKDGKENWIELPKDIEILKWSYIDTSNC